LWRPAGHLAAGRHDKRRIARRLDHGGRSAGRYKENAQPPKWQVIWDPATTMAFNGGSCVGAPIESFVGTGEAGPLAGFMIVLGNQDFGAQGGEAHVKRTVTLGQSTNVIDATVKAEVVSESGT
jgi:hypothetical protein